MRSRDVTKLIIFIIGINEEKNIGPLVKSLPAIKPDAVWFFDGPWKNGEPGDKSKDKTKENFEDACIACQAVHKFEYLWIDLRILYDSESDKRNRAIKIIEDTYSSINEPIWLMWMDADEEIRLPYGPAFYNLKQDLAPFENNFAIKLRTYTYNDPKAFLDGVRIFPGKQGNHFHTGAIMLLHDKEHKLIDDWHPTRQVIADPSKLLPYSFQFIHIINKWNLRDFKRLERKKECYFDEIRGVCKYGK